MTGSRAGVYLVAVAAALGTSAAPARAQADTAPAPADSVHAGVLFESDAPLQLRFAGDLRTLLNDRDSLKAEYHPFTLVYRAGDAAPESVAVRLRTRGHWRRQKRNCDYPPLLLNFPQSKVEGTVFAGQNRLKLVTPCRPSRRDYEQYVLGEYLAYKVYNLLTPLSLRVRLAPATYVDTTGRQDSLTTYTFLLEDAGQMAARNGARLLDAKGGRFADVDSLQLGLVGVFLYLIGGTDWSLSGLHNMELVQHVERGWFYPVAYDFDWTGIVNARYATPDARLRIRSVRDRLYRGRCLSEAHWSTVLGTFRNRQAEIYALYENLPGLDPRYVEETRRYLDDFYRVIDDPRKLSGELIRRCRQEEGI